MVPSSEETSFLTTFYDLYFQSSLHKWAAMVHHAPLFIDPHYDGIQIQNNNSFLFRINNYLPCQDLNPGPTGMKQIAYQCATMIR